MMIIISVRFGVTYGGRRIIKSLYEREVVVKIYGNKQEGNIIRKGAKEGAPHHHLYFNLHV